MNCNPSEQPAARVCSGLRPRRYAALASLAAALVIPLAGCADADAPAAGVREEVAFYPACGNETLELDGQTWYQLLEGEQEVEERRFQDGGRSAPGPTVGQAERTGVLLTASLARSGADRLAAQLPAVNPPGPGDDTGTLTVYPDGLARFESDSGRYTTWLTLEERTYGWVC